MLVPKTKTIYKTVVEERTRTVTVTVKIPKTNGYWIDLTGSGVADWAFYKSVGRGFVLGQGTVDGSDVQGTVWYYNIPDVPTGFYTVSTLIP